VLQLILRGLGNRQISAQFGISERAVKVHVSALLQKFSVTSRGALIANVLTALHGGGSLRRTISARTRARSLIVRFKPYEQARFMVAVTFGPEHRYVFCNEVAAPDRMFFSFALGSTISARTHARRFRDGGQTSDMA
jgi:hypothetical protein